MDGRIFFSFLLATCALVTVGVVFQKELNTIVTLYTTEIVVTGTALLLFVALVVILRWWQTQKQTNTSAQDATTTGLSAPKRIRHEDSDGEIIRNRWLRWLVLLATILLLVGSVGFAGWYLSGFLPIALLRPYGTIWGATFGAILMARIFPRWFLVVVPQIQAFVTLNPILALFGSKKDPNVTYGPGWGITFPFEQRTEKGNVSLDVVTIPYEENVPSNGPLLLVSGSYQFKPDIVTCRKFIGLDDTTIIGGVIDLIKARISGELATKNGDTARKNIRELNTAIGAYFGIETDDPDLEVSRFEEKYGVNTEQVTISGIDFGEAVQKTRDAVDEAANVRKAVANMYGLSEKALKLKMESREITIESYNDMVDRAFATSENATMNIQAFKGIEGAAKAFGEALGNALRK